MKLKWTIHVKMTLPDLNGILKSYAWSSMNSLPIFWVVLRIRIRWIRKILGSWIRIRKNMQIQGQNINQKLNKNILLSKPKSELMKKERFKKFPDFWIVYQILAKKKQTNKTQNLKILLCYKNSVNVWNHLDPDPDPFFSSADTGPGSGSASKLNGS